MQDWNNLTANTLIQHGGSTFILKYGSFEKLLQHRFPELPQKSKGNDSKAQRVLSHMIGSLIPSQIIHTNFIHQDLQFPTGYNMQLDIFLPDISLAFEYQGQHHYHGHYSGADTSCPMRDSHKRVACKATGISLIEIPYWWDNKKDSLAATIKKYRPDIGFTSSVTIGEPIRLKR